MSFKGSCRYFRFSTGKNQKELFVDVTQHVFNDVYTGAINGVNREFTTSNRFYPNSIIANLNGAEQVKGIDYTEEDDCESIVFTVAPTGGDILTIHYRKLTNFTCTPTAISIALREDNGYSLREDSGLELREV